jgi:hypothetical protein
MKKAIKIVTIVCCVVAALAPIWIDDINTIRLIGGFGWIGLMGGLIATY